MTRQAFNIEKTDRNDRFSSDCRFEFKLVDNIDLYVSIERYSSSKVSRTRIKKDADDLLYLGTRPEFTRVQLKTERAWDKVLAYRSKFPDHFVLLRKREYVITLISTRFDVLVNLEKELRGIDFGEEIK